MKAIFRALSQRLCVSLLLLCAAVGHAVAQPAGDQAVGATNSTSEQIGNLQLQLTNAWHEVEGIVNQPVTAYRMDPDHRVSIFSPGWFHPGAITPDFNTVDVRKSQQLIYTSPWVSSDITPTMMFRGSDLEFNAMTKLFYTNRNLPKKRLTEAEMLKINSLYRTIGHCQSEIARLQNPPGTETAADGQDATNDSAPVPVVASIEHIPQQTRIFYGTIAIGTLLVLVVAARVIRKRSD